MSSVNFKFLSKHITGPEELLNTVSCFGCLGMNLIVKIYVFYFIYSNGFFVDITFY